MVHEDSFMKALFHGVIPEDIIFPYPEMDGNERETVEMILQSIRKFADAHIDARMARTISHELSEGLPRSTTRFYNHPQHVPLSSSPLMKHA